MERIELQNKINSFGVEVTFAESEVPTQFLTAEVSSENVHALISELKNNSDTSFDYMFCQTGIDFPEHIEVLYHLRNTQNNSEIVIKAKIEDRENPSIDSVFDLYKTADFHEREIFDLFGVKFNNHPDLRRILLDDDWEGYPLRKDYVDEVNIVEL
ncbi:MAG TPA: NADH-quinone oxidoreductase subunit C [Flavobacteriales bacterium]|jgi:NADH/F420H2 dehydrogenase subunit C|nr:NADH-quinone oxidoreductase subunit C [Flavobacteriales bacterium]|tara:strand:+ start:494 stop:961 length:468 start_codon:yes stop_codon:yes gene_type:complete